MLGEADSSMHHGLLVARLVEAEARILLKRLSDAGHVSVTEDAKTSPEEGLLDSVPLHILIGKELDYRLGRREPLSGAVLHRCPLESIA